MSDRIKALREQRAQIVADARKVIETAEAEKRELTAEELAKHEELFGKADNLRKQVETLERQRDLEAAETEKRDAAKRGEQRDLPGERESAKPTASDEYRHAFGKWLRGGRNDMTSDELRALSLGIGSAGGFTVAPEQMTAGLIKFLDDNVAIRGLATVLNVGQATRLGAMSLEADPSDADWTSEIATGAEDSSMAFGKRQMAPNPLAKRIKISNELLRLNTGLETFVRDRLGYKFAITEERAFLLGNGANQPLGLFVASADGVPTGRDISAGNTSTSIGFDGLINAKYALKGAYRSRARWMFHRDAISQIAKLKDTTNQYLWQPSVQAGEPDRILGIPVITSEYVPNTFTTGLYVGMLADFSFYWIVDSFDLQIQRLVELYAETNQTGLIGRKQLDAQPVLAEAFARVKLA